MDITEIFRKTLVRVVKASPYGTQSRLSRETGIDVKYLNDYIHGRKDVGESVRVKISEFFGYKYWDFLAMGAQEEKQIYPLKFPVFDPVQKRTIKFKNPKVDRILTLLERLDQEGNTAGIDKIAGCADEWAEREELAKLKARVEELERMMGE